MSQDDAHYADHTDIAAYALGLLDEPDRVAVERHLPGCPSCSAELAELSGMRALLDGIPASAVAEPEVERPAAPSPPPIRRESGVGRRPVLSTLAAAAAGVAIFVGGIFIGTSHGDSGTEPDNVHRPAGDLLLYGTRFSATDPGTGVTGIVGIGPKGWGTHVALELRGVSGRLTCQLVAVSRSGAEETVATWRVPDQGYGVPGGPDPLVIHGGTGFTEADIDRFEVRVVGQGTILTVPVAA
jgi:Putative zinc-finger